MNNLLEFTIKAHGGLTHWNKFKNVSAHLNVDGMTWVRKQQPGILKDVNVSVEIEQQLVSFQSKDQKWKTFFDSQRIAAETDEGKSIEELLNPRQSFEGHTRETPWSRLQAFYFASYAIWIYFNAPFCFAHPDYEVTEIEPWEENGETFRRLQVTFPDYLVTHSRIQTFYIDKAGLIRRHDYNVEISENAAGAHYLYDYEEIQGIKFPTRRQVFIRNQDNTTIQPEPVLVLIDLSEITLK
ncbi:hypothetical protein GCM10022217_12500 [Chryseobacterium ginsenosidimutans]|uniref:hypothetical protein n=1 Tax=Chryseobacterium ginsenosidimutans TaxID=687846 RepID=UPI0031CEA42D